MSLTIKRDFRLQQFAYELTYESESLYLNQLLSPIKVSVKKSCDKAVKINPINNFALTVE